MLILFSFCIVLIIFFTHIKYTHNHSLISCEKNTSIKIVMSQIPDIKKFSGLSRLSLRITLFILNLHINCQQNEKQKYWFCQHYIGPVYAYSMCVRYFVSIFAMLIQRWLTRILLFYLMFSCSSDNANNNKRLSIIIVTCNNVAQNGIMLSLDDFSHNAKHSVETIIFVDIKSINSSKSVFSCWLAWFIVN